MKILQLNLLAFGPFTKTVLNLSAGTHGLHLIYGPNEAGKSSALRAIRQMLYGIDTQTDDNFVHTYPNLRVGARLRHSDDSQLEFVRRKGRKNTVRDATDHSPLSDAELARYLGGINSDIFRTMFGIDHERLTEGGREIVNGQGELGEILFLAGSGVTQLHSVRNSLAEQMGELFKSKGHNPRINHAIAELRENRKEIRSIQLSSSEWLKHQKAFRQAGKKLADVDQQLKKLETNRSRLERFRQAVPLITNLRQRQVRLEPVAAAVLLPTDFSARRRQVEKEQLLAEQAKSRAEKRIVELGTEIEAIDVPTELLAQAKVIDALYRRFGSVQKAMQDKPTLAEGKRQAQLTAESILHDLRPHFPMERVEELRLKRTDIRRIRDRGTERDALFAFAESTQAKLEQTRQTLHDLHDQLRDLPDIANPSSLRERCERILEDGKLEKRFQDETMAMQSLRSDCERARNRLSLWPDSLAELEQYPLPADETVNRFESGFNKVERRIAERNRDRLQFETEIREIEQQLETIRIDQNVPSESELTNARTLRDSGWLIVRKAWLDGVQNDAEQQAFAAKFETKADLPIVYERSVEVADEIADRLRHEADNVANRANLESSRNAKTSRLIKLNEELSDLTAERITLQSEWERFWPRLDEKPLPPKEMRVWLVQCRNLLEQADAVRRQSQSVASLQEIIEEHRREMMRLLTECDEPPNREAALSELLVTGQDFVKTFEKQRHTRQNLEAEIEKGTEEETRVDEAIHNAIRNKNEWENIWAADMQSLGLESTATPSETNEMLDGLGELFGKLKEAETLEGRICDIDRDIESFSQNIGSFVSTFAIDLAPLPPEQAAATLNARVGKARSAENHRETLQKELGGHDHDRRNAEDTLSDCRLLLIEMCRKADCEDPAELETAEERSQLRLALEKEVGELEDALREISGGLSLEEFLQQAEKIDPDALTYELSQIADEADELQRERDAHRDSIRDEKHALSQMDGSAQAAELEEKSQELIAGLESDVEQYVRLKLASVLLQQGMQRYQENNQTPVLKRSGELFRHLTRRSFADLKDEYDDTGRAVLAGIRAETEASVNVKEMSDGTCDQLYLALRIAGLESYLDQHEPLPFIVDDVLLNFDDDRAVAGLETLAELSQRTQVIFFTHHRHLLDLAERHLPKSVLHVHELNA